MTMTRGDLGCKQMVKMSRAIIALWLIVYAIAILLPSHGYCDSNKGSENRAKKQLAYQVYQDKAISLLEDAIKVSSQVETNSKSHTIAEFRFPDGSLNYLSAVLYFCTVRKGRCNVVLDGMLSLDIYNSYILGKASCPNLLGLWKNWITNEFEKRIGYDLTIATAATYNNFKKTERVRYIKCSKTIQSVMKKEGEKFDEWVREAYSTKGEMHKKLKLFRDYLVAIREKIPNIFIHIGAH